MEGNINLTDIIFNSLNELFSKLFSSIDNSIYSLLDEITFITPKLLENNSFVKIFGTSSNNGILLICNSLVFGFILYYSINYLISHLIYSKIDSPKQFIFKSIIFIAVMNSSLWICEQIVNIISTITDGLYALSYSLFSSDLSFSRFIDNINKTLSISGDFNLFSFDGIIKSFTTFGLINLVFNNSLRYIMIQIFILISPFAMLSLINNSSEWFFRVWIKNFISLLLMQILISLILLLSFSIDISSNHLFSKLLYIGTIFALSKANIYMKELLGRNIYRCKYKYIYYFKKIERRKMHFIFPKNYNFKPKLFGFIEYSTAILDTIIGISIYFFVNFAFSNINIRIYIFITLFLPVLLMSILGINKESFITVFKYVFKFVKNQNIYLYTRNNNHKK